MSKLYVKMLTTDCDRNLVSCHGGTMIWRVGKTAVPAEDVGADAELCGPGLIHVCRLADMPIWLSTHIAIVEVQDQKPLIGKDKVGVRDATILRCDKTVNGLLLLADFADHALSHPPEAWSAWIVQQFPAGYFDGVEA